MRITRSGRFERTDIWREGKWLDLWSVVHFLSGMTIGFVAYLLHLGDVASVIIVFLGLVAYEMWEKIVGIEEMPTNRVMDVVVGMASFMSVFFYLAPRLSVTSYILTAGFTITANVVGSVFGWIASQKAAALKKRAHERYLRQRSRLRSRAAAVRKSLEQEVI